MSIPVRKAVRVLLLNDRKELLLMCAENCDIKTQEGKANKRLWFTIGGAIEADETLQQAALREIYEETGIQADQVALGPVVWFGEVDLVLKGKLTRLSETYIVATTTQKDVSMIALTEDEKAFAKDITWFSFEDIQHSTDTIFPLPLARYLPDILAQKYPIKPIKIDLKTK